MSDLQPSGQNDFLIEKIKVKPVDKRKLFRRTMITVAMAVIFGLVACFTFLILEPVISNWLYPPEEPQVQMVAFPEDQDEMSPEEMLAENLPTEPPAVEQEPEPEGGEEVPEEPAEPTLEEQIMEILPNVQLNVTMDLGDYRELYSAMYDYIDEMSRYVVTVTAVTSNIDWFNDVQESRNQCSGVIVFENGMELLILTDYSPIKSAERLLLTFYDNTQVEAQLKRQNQETGLAVLSVPLENLPESLRGEEGELPIAKFGTSNLKNPAGIPVVALGSPMGTSGSVGYGMITSAGTTLSMTDRNYKLFQTNINGSQNASGVLFNLQGQVIGIITNNKSSSDMRYMITAYGITELQKMVEKMSNAIPIAYMGIKGVDVPREANQELGVPYGAYVESIDMDSPAMQAGIQRGDVITALGESKVTNFNGYSTVLMQMEPGQTVEMVVMRRAQEEYREMRFQITLEELRQ